MIYEAMLRLFEAWKKYHLIVGLLLSANKKRVFYLLLVWLQAF